MVIRLETSRLSRSLTHSFPNHRPQALRTIQTIVANVVGNPHEAKYRQVKKSNAAFDRRVGSGAYVWWWEYDGTALRIPLPSDPMLVSSGLTTVPGTGAIMRAAGFGDSGETWDLTPTEQGWNVICRCVCMYRACERWQ